MKPAFKLIASFVAIWATSNLSCPSFAQEADRQVVSLVSLTPATSTNSENVNDAFPFRGQLFDKAFVQYIDADGGLTIFPNRDGYDLFEADLIVDCSEITDAMRFYVLGDGEVIYESPRLTPKEKPVHISVPIDKYKAISLSVKALRFGGLPRAIWAAPRFVRLTAAPLTEHPASVNSDASASLVPDLTATTPEDVVTLGRATDGRYTISVNGNLVRFGNVTPQMKAGRLLVPMRPLFEALGAKVNYNSADQTIRATRSGREIKMQVGSTNAFVNETSAPMEVPAQSLMGTTMVPFRFVVESFDLTIKYANN